MHPVEDYKINVVSLPNKKKKFSFRIDDALFAAFQSDMLQHGKGRAEVEIDKSLTTIEVNFLIEGAVELTCDRTLEPFEHPISLKKRVYFKFGEEYEELSDELIVLPRHFWELDFSQFIYDFIILSLPTKKLHPDVADQEEEIIYSSSTDGEIAQNPSENDDEDIDPRWEKLKKLNFKDKK